MPPKGWRQGIPPPGYVFDAKSKNAERFKGVNHDGTIPLANSPKVKDQSVPEGASPSPPKKKHKKDDGTPSRPHKKSGSKSQQEERPVSKAKSATREAAQEQPQDDADESEEDDPVWDEFRQDFYEIVDQLPLELQRSFLLLRELDEQVDANTTELSTLVRQYTDERTGKTARAAPPPPSPSSATSPSSYHILHENGGNAVAGPSGYNGSMDVDDEEAVAAAVEPEEPSLELSPPGSASTLLPSGDAEHSTEAPRSPTPSQGTAELDPMDLLYSPGVPPSRRRPRSRSPSTSVVPATPSPRTSISHSQPSVVQNISAHDPLSLSQEIKVDSSQGPPSSNPTALDPVASNPAPLPVLTFPAETVNGTTSRPARLSSSHPPSPSTVPPPSKLSRIATLISLLIKTGEEKVAVAKGTCDRIDRQIRSMDSALDTHINSITTEALAALAATAAAANPPKPKAAKPAAVAAPEPVVEVKSKQPVARAPGREAEEDEDEEDEEPVRAPRRRVASSTVPSSSHKKRRRSFPAEDSQFKTDSEEDEAYQDEGDEEEEDEWAAEEGRPTRHAAKPNKRTKAGRSVLKRMAKSGSSGSLRTKKGRRSSASAAKAEVVEDPEDFSEKALAGLEIDSREPRFCYCQNVSYGEMIGCDNDDCELEWFHFKCVGLTAPVVGKWYCRDCEYLFEDD